MPEMPLVSFRAVVLHLCGILDPSENVTQLWIISIEDRRRVQSGAPLRVRLTG